VRRRQREEQSSAELSPQYALMNEVLSSESEDYTTYLDIKNSQREEQARKLMEQSQRQSVVSEAEADYQEAWEEYLLFLSSLREQRIAALAAHQANTQIAATRSYYEGSLARLENTWRERHLTQEVLIGELEKRLGFLEGISQYTEERRFLRPSKPPWRGSGHVSNTAPSRFAAYQPAMVRRRQQDRQQRPLKASYMDPTATLPSRDSRCQDGAPFVEVRKHYPPAGLSSSVVTPSPIQKMDPSIDAMSKPTDVRPVADPSIEFKQSRSPSPDYDHRLEALDRHWRQKCSEQAAFIAELAKRIGFLEESSKPKRNRFTALTSHASVQRAMQPWRGDGGWSPLAPWIPPSRTPTPPSTAFARKAR